MIRRFISSLVLGFVLVSCGGDDAAHEFADAYAAKYCARYLRCDRVGEDPEEIAERATLTQAECERLMGGDFDIGTEALLDQGRIRFDGDAGRECLDSFDDLCAGGDFTACYNLFEGTVATGGSCRESSECVSQRCSSNGISCGTCLASARAGESCTVEVPCVGGSICRNGVCEEFDEGSVQQVGLGESCAETLTTDYVCAPDLYCDDNDRCAARLAVGLRCSGDACVTDAVCLFDAADEERCAPITVTELVGADCGPLANGSGWVECDRDSRLYCDDGVCARLGGNGELGSDCFWNDDCDSGLCGFDDLCVASDLPNGSACELDEQCESYECSTGNLCVAPACF